MSLLPEDVCMYVCTYVYDISLNSSQNEKYFRQEM